MQRCVMGSIAAVLALLAFPVGSAGAVEPVAGGEYVGECCGLDDAFYGGYSIAAELRVGPGGHTLLGGRRGSYIACDQDGGLVPLRPRRAVPVKHDGSFAFSGRRLPVPRGRWERALRLKVRGRFTSPDSARIVYSVTPTRPAGNDLVFGCRQGPKRLRLHRDAGDPPFAGCASQPGTTIVSSSEARVFEQRRVFYSAFLPFAYGCLYSGDHRVTLSLDGFDQTGAGVELDNFRVAGPYVAFGCGGNLSSLFGCGSAVHVVDLRDGSRRRAIPTIIPYDWERAYGPSDVELKANSSVAWISGRKEGPWEVGALDSKGQRQLDSGDGIEPESLMLDGSILSWRAGNDIRSATLD